MAKTVKINKNGMAAIRLTNHSIFALSLICAASLYEEGEDAEVKAVLGSLPKREDLKAIWDGGVYLDTKTKTIKMRPELLPTLKKMMRRASEGGWPQMRALTSRIKAIDAIPPLQLLALAGK